MPKKTTSKSVATKASGPLKNSNSQRTKSVSGSALSQAKMPKKVTSKEVAIKASKTLSDGRTSKTTKSIAGSVLTQRETKKSGRKK